MDASDESWIRDCIEQATRLLDVGESLEAEKLLDTALKMSEGLEPEGPVTGLVLLELHSLYENQGREIEAAIAWKRVRVILAREEHRAMD